MIKTNLVWFGLVECNVCAECKNYWHDKVAFMLTNNYTKLLQSFDFEIEYS